MIKNVKMLRTASFYKKYFFRTSSSNNKMKYLSSKDHENYDFKSQIDKKRKNSAITNMVMTIIALKLK